MNKPVAIFFFLLFLLHAGLAGAAGDVDFPKKEITMVVPFSPGGGADTYVRMVSPFISKHLNGTSVVIQNIPGGDTITGLMKIYNARADGYTIGLFMTPGQAVRQVVGNIDYDLEKVTWLGRISTMSYVMTLSPKSKFKSLKDLQSADKVLLGVANISGAVATLITCEKLKINITPVTHKGSKEAILAAIRGDVDFVQFPLSTVQQNIKAGDLVPIVAFFPERLPDLKDVPTVKELGYRELLDIVQIGYYLGGPPKIPPGVVKILRTAVEIALKDKELHEKANKVKMPILGADSEETREDIERLLKTYAPFKGLLAKYLK